MVWKKNTPYLYDLVVSHALEWPSLTVQWLPDKIIPSLAKDETAPAHSTQRLLLGTHTSEGEMNYLLFAEVTLPIAGSTIVDAHTFSRDGVARQGDTAAAAAAAATAATTASKGKSGGGGGGGGGGGDAPAVVPTGAYGGFTSRVRIVQRIPHTGEVNRARASPHNPDVVATRGPTPDVCVFDRTRHASAPPVNAFIEPRPDIVLKGHTKVGDATVQ
jgi:histone-binding protein RBBP4